MIFRNQARDSPFRRLHTGNDARDDHAGRAAVRGRGSQAPWPRLDLRSRYAPSVTSTALVKLGVSLCC